MNSKEDYNFGDYINNAQKKVREFVHERNQLNDKLKNYILNLQSIDSEIYNSIFDAREFYNEKRNTYNIKLRNLKRKKIEYEQLWDRLTKELSTLSKPKLNNDLSISIDSTKQSIEDIEYEINTLNKKLEEQLLDIEEENEIIEKLRELEENKPKEINRLVELEQKQATKFQTSHYYITQTRIETLEKNLKEIYETLIELSNKRLMTHKKMFDLCRKVREFEKIKKEIENELTQNISTADGYNQLFLQLMAQNKKKLLDKLSNSPEGKVQPRRRVQPREIETPKVKAIIKKKKKYKRLGQKKLAIALDKQKSGKKLDFYELQLILKHSKNKR
ncbi:MAG: hypothetical protein ACXAC5_07900 [Promethearchaeota archaeon]|jgi:uncharacterized coiled-coil DUF342 family protein